MNKHEDYSPSTVVLTVTLAFLGAYVAMCICEQLRQSMIEDKVIFGSQVTISHRKKHILYLLLMSISLSGVSVWAMHFVGMHSCHIYDSNNERIHFKYNVSLEVLTFFLCWFSSFVGVMIASHDIMFSKTKTEIVEEFVADSKRLSFREIRKMTKEKMLYIISTKDMSRLIIAGTIMGSGIVVMHYIAMESMELPGRVKYNAGLVALSVIIAIIASIISFWVFFRLLSIFPAQEYLRVISALMMALAVSGMHFTGMESAHYVVTGIVERPIATEVMHASLMSSEHAYQGVLIGGNILLWLITFFALWNYRTLTTHQSKIIRQADHIIEKLVHTANQASVNITPSQPPLPPLSPNSNPNSKPNSSINTNANSNSSGTNKLLLKQSFSFSFGDNAATKYINQWIRGPPHPLTHQHNTSFNNISEMETPPILSGKSNSNVGLSEVQLEKQSSITDNNKNNNKKYKNINTLLLKHNGTDHLPSASYDQSHLLSHVSSKNQLDTTPTTSSNTVSTTVLKQLAEAYFAKRLRGHKRRLILSVEGNLLLQREQQQQMGFSEFVCHLLLLLCTGEFKQAWYAIWWEIDSSAKDSNSGFSDGSVLASQSSSRIVNNLSTEAMVKSDETEAEKANKYKVVSQKMEGPFDAELRLYHDDIESVKQGSDLEAGSNNKEENKKYLTIGNTEKKNKQVKIKEDNEEEEEEEEENKDSEKIQGIAGLYFHELAPDVGKQIESARFPKLQKAINNNGNAHNISSIQFANNTDNNSTTILSRKNQHTVYIVASESGNTNDNSYHRHTIDDSNNNINSSVDKLHV